MTRIPRDKALKRARELVELAAHADTPKEEARTSAVKACRYINAYKLLDAPEEANPLKTAVDIINDPNVQAAAGAVSHAVGMAANAFRERRRRR